jgi:hypothetical protein
VFLQILQLSERIPRLGQDRIWSLTLREEHRLRVFENRVLRIFGPKRDEMARDWRKLHNDELHRLYSFSSTSIIGMIQSRRMRWEGHVARIGRKRLRIGYT